MFHALHYGHSFPNGTMELSLSCHSKSFRILTHLQHIYVCVSSAFFFSGLFPSFPWKRTEPMVLAPMVIDHCPMKLASVTVVFKFAATALHSGYHCYLYTVISYTYINDFGLVLYTSETHVSFKNTLVYAK